MNKTLLPLLILLGLLAAHAADKTVTVNLAYQSPGDGPKPNFSPKGAQVPLTPVPANLTLPSGAVRPAKTGFVQIGPGRNSWIPILVTADPAHPRDLCRLYIDRNRNGSFADDGDAILAEPKLNEKTKAWWSSFNGAKLSAIYSGAIEEPYLVNFWAVREAELPPEVIRYSVGSWRSGRVNVEGVEALVAVMDSDNNAVFDPQDWWSVLGAAEPDAAKRVLSIAEAKPANRLMFVQKSDGKELVLEFRRISPDGRSLTFAVVDRAITKAADRAPDDTLAVERARPRAVKPFPWLDSDLDRALALARESGRKVILDFWATWCGPCHTLDEWIWSDAEVAAQLNADYIGVKLDGDLEKDRLVARFHVEGYPTLIVLDASGKELRRFGYLQSKEMLQELKR